MKEYQFTYRNPYSGVTATAVVLADSISDAGKSADAMLEKDHLTFNAEITKIELVEVST